MKYVIITILTIMFSGCTDVHKAPTKGTYADAFIKKYKKDSRYYCSGNILLKESVGKNAFGYYFSSTTTYVVDNNSAMCKK